MRLVFLAHGAFSVVQVAVFAVMAVILAHAFGLVVVLLLAPLSWFFCEALVQQQDEFTKKWR